MEHRVRRGRNEDGRRVQRWQSGFATKKEADEALREQLRRVDQDDFVAPVKQTFKEYAIGTWLPFVKVK